MDPFLEDPFFWHQVHSRLIVALANTLGPALRPKYYAAIETRTYLDDGDEGLLVGIPDAIVFSPAATKAPPRPAGPSTLLGLQPQKVQLIEPLELTERFLEIRKVVTHQVITAIEILSPKNKQGDGRKRYLKKRQTVLQSATHLIEIDLLRAFTPMPLAGSPTPSHYRILVSNAVDRPDADLYSFNLPDPIPAFPLPLQPEDPAPTIDLASLLQEVYEQGCFDLQIDYHQPIPAPELAEADRQWVRGVLEV